MAEFKVINTQEEFDAAIKERLERERTTTEKKYGDYESLKAKAAELDAIKAKDYEGQLAALESKYSEAKSQIESHGKVVSELTSRATTAEAALLKAKIAHEFKIPYELSGKLTGSTEEELRKDAETFAKFVNISTPAPLASTEPVIEDAQSAALRETLRKMKGE